MHSSPFSGVNVKSYCLPLAHLLFTFSFSHRSVIIYKIMFHKSLITTIIFLILKNSVIIKILSSQFLVKALHIQRQWNLKWKHYDRTFISLNWSKVYYYLSKQWYFAHVSSKFDLEYNITFGAMNIVCGVV